jgi:hypothetical protein
MGKLVIAVVTVAVIAAVISGLPDIKRYLEMRNM